MHPGREAHYAFDPPRAQGVHPLSPGQLCIGPHDAPTTIFRRRASAVRLELRSRAGRTDCARGSHCRRQARRAEAPRAVRRANHACRAGERVRERTSRQPRRRDEEPAPGDWRLLQRTARPSLPRGLALAVQGGDWKGIGLMLFMTLLLLFFGRTLWRGSHLARARTTSKLVQGQAGEPALHIQSPYRCERWPSGERAKSFLTHRSNAVPTAGHIACKALSCT